MPKSRAEELRAALMDLLERLEKNQEPPFLLVRMACDNTVEISGDFSTDEILRMYDGISLFVNYHFGPQRKRWKLRSLFRKNF